MKINRGRFSRVTRIFSLLKPYRGMVVLITVLQAIILGTRMVGPYVNQVLVDDVIGRGQTQKLWWVLGAFMGLAVLRAGLFCWRATACEVMGQGATVNLKVSLYRHLQRLSFSFYDEHRIGEIMSRMTGDIDGVRHMITVGWLQVLELCAYFIGATVIMMFISWKLTLLILAVMPFLAVLAYRYDKKIGPVYADIREQNAHLNTRVQENLAGVRVVKAYAREDYEVERFDKENNEVLHQGLRAVKQWVRFNPIIDFLSSLPTVILYGFGALFVLSSKQPLSIGELVAMNGYLWMISEPLRQISFIVNMVQQSLTSSEKVFYYLDMGSTVREKEDAKAPEQYTGHVQFDHVRFRYGDNVVLDDVSFDVPPGNTLAIMGATGTGKSTIVSLIPRFYDCFEGAVRVDGIDVKDHKLQELRRQVGLVMQDTFLFSDSLAENIAFGRPDAPQSDVERAADVAQGAEFIANMADGYEAQVGERGLGLSGGQKQRVSIARALACDPKILILDDSTSAVDMETEYAIQQGLAAPEYAGLTKIIIAHRISSVKDANEIIVLDDGGKIAERGTHAQLLAAGGLYTQMFHDQYRDYAQMKGGAAHG